MYTFTYCQLLPHIIYIHDISKNTEKPRFWGDSLGCFCNSSLPTTTTTAVASMILFGTPNLTASSRQHGNHGENTLVSYDKNHYPQGINISHLGNRKIIFKMPFLGDMLVPWRVLSLKIRFLLLKIGWLEDEISFSGWTICRGLSC